MALDLRVEGSALEPELGPPTGLTLFLSDAERSRLLSFRCRADSSENKSEVKGQ